MYDLKMNPAVKIWEEVMIKIKNELDVNAYSTFFLPIVAKDLKDNPNTDKNDNNLNIKKLLYNNLAVL